MKKYSNLLLIFLVSLITINGFVLSYSETGESKLFKTYPLERYMFQKYDSQGFDGYTLVLAIRQPVPNSRELVDESFDTGDAFLRLAKSGKHAWTSYFSYGYESTEEEFKYNSKVNIHLDATSEFTVAKVFTITELDAQNVEKYLWDEYKTVKNYDEANNNSITFLLNVAKKANIPEASIGIVPRNFVLPQFVTEDPLLKSEFDKEIKNYFGYSAADAAEDMKATGGVVFYDDMPK